MIGLSVHVNTLIMHLLHYVVINSGFTLAHNCFNVQCQDIAEQKLQV